MAVVVVAVEYIPQLVPRSAGCSLISVFSLFMVRFNLIPADGAQRRFSVLLLRAARLSLAPMLNLLAALKFYVPATAAAAAAGGSLFEAFAIVSALPIRSRSKSSHSPIMLQRN